MLKVLYSEICTLGRHCGQSPTVAPCHPVSIYDSGVRIRLISVLALTVFGDELSQEKEAHVCCVIAFLFQTLYPQILIQGRTAQLALLGRTTVILSCEHLSS